MSETGGRGAAPRAFYRGRSRAQLAPCGPGAAARQDYPNNRTKRPETAAADMGQQETHAPQQTIGRARASRRLLRVGQTVLLTPQKNGSGPRCTPVTFLRQA
jgi:hypothetical protein